MMMNSPSQVAFIAVLVANLSCSESLAGIGERDSEYLAIASPLGTVPQLSHAQTRQIKNQWIAIPDWMAGKWQTKFQTFLNCYDYRTGKSRNEQPATICISRQRVLGTLKDGVGQIWHFTGTPYTRASGTERYTEIQRIEELELIHSSLNEVKVRTVGFVSRWSAESGELLDSFREVTLATYTPLSDGVIKTDLTIVDYDECGKALMTSQSVCIENRIQPFVNIERDDRGNLKELFRRYIDGHKFTPR